MTNIPKCYVRGCDGLYVGSIGSEWKYPGDPLPACEPHYTVGKKPFDGACAECGQHTMKLPLCVRCRDGWLVSATPTGETRTFINGQKLVDGKVIDDD